MPALLILLLVPVIFGGLWLHARSNIRVADQRMAGREPLTSAEFARRHFSPRQAPIAARLRELLAAETAVSLERLHPDDGLVRDLRIDELDSLALTEFIMAIEREFGIQLSDADVSRIRTFREIVDLVDRQTGSAGTA